MTSVLRTKTKLLTREYCPMYRQIFLLATQVFQWRSLAGLLFFFLTYFYPEITILFSIPLRVPSRDCFIVFPKQSQAITLLFKVSYGKATPESWGARLISFHPSPPVLLDICLKIRWLVHTAGTYTAHGGGGGAGGGMKINYAPLQTFFSECKLFFSYKDRVCKQFILPF